MKPVHVPGMHSGMLDREIFTHEIGNVLRVTNIEFAISIMSSILSPTTILQNTSSALKIAKNCLRNFLGLQKVCDN